MLVLGISAYYHDSAACLLRDGKLVAAIEEERLSRTKHDSSFPILGLRHCLRAANVDLQDIDCVAFYENPSKKLARQRWMAEQPGATAELKLQVTRRSDPGRFVGDLREIAGYTGRVEFFDHHASHAASSFFFSGFEDAAILTVDGVGEWATTTYGHGTKRGLELLEEVRFPHSLGLLYSAITAYLGFEVNEGEYKVMGLAPYGTPRYADRIGRLVKSTEQGRFELDLRYFDLFGGRRMFTDELGALLGGAPRSPESEIASFHHDVARSLQVVLEELLLEKARYLHGLVPTPNLCMAGGVALNCVANGTIRRRGPFERLFVQPAAGDDGGALGAAALAHLKLTGAAPDHGRLAHVYTGPAYGAAEVARLFRATGLTPLDFRDREDALVEATVDRLAAGKVVGWFSGAMEFGPRALGARSILGDPRDPEMRSRINALVKKREAFRPFAPAVLADRAAEHFDLDRPSPFMTETCPVRSALPLAAITHVDGSARVQTVDGETNPRFALLLTRFADRTGCPILLNTSFNVRGEPIVCSPLDALLCFSVSKIDTLVLEDFVLDRSALPKRWETIAETAHSAHASVVSHDVYAML